MDDILFEVQNYFILNPFFIPLGAIGIWRWSVWAIKRSTALFYKATKPLKNTKGTRISVVTPVYNEDPGTFSKALTSWKKNKPKEIIAVIDYTDKKCIDVFKKFKKANSRLATLIITKVPGKRPALVLGIKKAKGDILALVDSDTIWSDKVILHAAAPFKNKIIAGVATRQSVIGAKTLAQKLFSIRLEQRFWDDVPFLARTGSVQSCLSGRTAFYRKEVVLPFLKEFVNEKFLGRKVISGEDKRLTYLIERAGWQVAYQDKAQVFTTGIPELSAYINQQIRWTRNSWRADLKALMHGWTLRHPIFTLFLLDRSIQPFTLLLSPIFFFIAIFYGQWIPAAIIFAWWFLSRGIRMFPHLTKKPSDVKILPAFIFFNFLSAYIRIYSLFSLNTQGWITRWDKSRMTKFSFFRVAPAYIATLLVAVGVITTAYQYKNYTYFIPLNNQKLYAQRTLLESSNLALSANKNVLGASQLATRSALIESYEVKENQPLYNVAQNLGLDTYNLLYANSAKITNWNNLTPGLILNIPPSSLSLQASYKFNYQRVYPDFLQIYFDEEAKSIIVKGRGTQITLADISNALGKEYIEEVSPKVWFLKTNLYLSSGTSIRLHKDQVTWLKLKSDKKDYAIVRGYNATVLIDGVRISSWDNELNTYDQNQKDGRSFILVKDGSRMDIKNSELSYLGFARTPQMTFSPYGVSWRMSTGKLGTTILTGDVINSKFHHNYFGAYTYGATGMLWRGNEFYANTKYGLDPHDDSNGFLVENNSFHNNGTHGLIFSKRCINNIVRNNVSYDNKLHGIMLHQASNYNLIENNKLYGNTDGVAINDSNFNIVRNNTIFNNKSGVRANKNSKNNSIEKNKIYDNYFTGVYLYEGAEQNAVKNNKLTKNKYGIYIKSNKNQISTNSIESSLDGIYLLGDAKENSFYKNKISYSQSYAIYTKLNQDYSNSLSGNSLYHNRKGIYALDMSAREYEN